MPVFKTRKLSIRVSRDVLHGIPMLGLCLFMVSFGYSGTTDPPSMSLQGVVISQRDSAVIPNVHIINISSARATISGTDGQFWIHAAVGDSIRFQAIGFETLVHFVHPGLLDNEGNHLVTLEEKTYELPVVEVFPYQTFSEFKYAFLNFDEPDEPDYTIEFPEFIPEPDLEKMPLGFGVAIPGPITFLYDRFSKRGKAQRKYQNVLIQEDLARRAERVVNPQIIERLTGLKERGEINTFLIYCGITDEYVVNTRDTEVYARIIACYEAYEAEGR
jgi:hypothetical protein